VTLCLPIPSRVSVCSRRVFEEVAQIDAVTHAGRALFGEIGCVMDRAFTLGSMVFSLLSLFCGLYFFIPSSLTAYFLSNLFSYFGYLSKFANNHAHAHLRTHACSGPRTARVTCVRDATVLICPWTLLEKVFAAHEVATVTVSASSAAAATTAASNTTAGSTAATAASASAAASNTTTTGSTADGTKPQAGKSSGPNHTNHNSNANANADGNQNAVKTKMSEAARAFARLKNDAFERWLFSQSAIDRTEADIDRLLESAGDAITQVNALIILKLFHWRRLLF
jgi:hypothetical protein